MLLQKSLTVIVLIYFAMVCAHPTNKLNHKRLKRGDKKTRKPRKTEDCVSDFCEKVATYPSKEVNSLIKEQHLPPLDFFLREYEAPVLRSTSHNENLCETFSRTLRPRRALNLRRKKEYVVQANAVNQSIYMEVCRATKTKMNLDCMPNGYSELLCVQEYRLIPMLIYDEKAKILRPDTFQVPSGCSVRFEKIRQVPV